MRVFQEKQRFDQWWIWLLFLLCFGVLFIDPFQKIMDGKSFSFSTFNEGFWIGFTVMVLVILLFRLLTLNTEIDEKGIRYQFSPFHRSQRQVSWADMEKCYTRKYRPISEYGGWGLRMGTKGGAYNVRGSQGIQILYKNGKKLLIGTQKSEEAQQVIDKYFHNERV